MKRILLAAVAAVTVLAVAGTVFAAGNTTVTVTASVLATCRFGAGAPTLAFGPLDPAAAGNVTGSTTVSFWCTRGVTTDSIAADNGSNWSGTTRNMITAGGDLIPYSLTLSPDANPNTGPSTPRTLTLNGSINGADYADKTAGDYTDTVTLTITP